MKQHLLLLLLLLLLRVCCVVFSHASCLTYLTRFTRPTDVLRAPHVHMQSPPLCVLSTNRAATAPEGDLYRLEPTGQRCDGRRHAACGWRGRLSRRPGRQRSGGWHPEQGRVGCIRLLWPWEWEWERRHSQQEHKVQVVVAVCV